MHDHASELIDLLNLEPHPEGGYFREIFRSARPVNTWDGRGRRSALTSIYFLLVDGAHSCWHRVHSDEVWSHLKGDSIELFWIESDGKTMRRTILGSRTSPGAWIEVVPADCWQAARTHGQFSLVSCVVGPGFEFDDFTMLRDVPREAAELIERFPQMKRFI